MKVLMVLFSFFIAMTGFSQEIKLYKPKVNRMPTYKIMPQKTFDITYGFRITVPENSFNAFNLTIPLPANVNGQKLESFTVSHPYGLKKAASHYLDYIYLDLKNAFKKSKTIDIIINAKVTKSEKQNELSVLDRATINQNASAYKNYTGSDNIINLDHPQLAADIAPMNGKSIKEKVNYAYDLVRKRMKYYSVGKGLKPLNSILTNYVGECGDFSTYFIALLRKMGIPARHVVGKIIDKQNFYHAWAEFYIDNMWIPVDVTNPTFKGKKLFGYEPCEYMPFHWGINMEVNFGSQNFVLGILQAYSFTHLNKKNAQVSVNFEPIWTLK